MKRTVDKKESASVLPEGAEDKPQEGCLFLRESEALAPNDDGDAQKIISIYRIAVHGNVDQNGVLVSV
jgi:hypothetical protein